MEISTLIAFPAGSFIAVPSLLLATSKALLVGVVSSSLAATRLTFTKAGTSCSATNLTFVLPSLLIKKLFLPVISSIPVISPALYVDVL